MGVQHAAESPRRRELAANGRTDADEMIAKGLGWFSVGLGLAELLAPRRVADAIGSPSRPALVRFLGLREIAAGVGILAAPRPAPWLWSRVAGDVMDLAVLGRGMRSPRADRERLGAAATAVVGVTALDVLASLRTARKAKAKDGVASRERAMHVLRSITINKPATELYAYWRDLRNLPQVMRHLESVETEGDGTRSHWVAKGPAGAAIRWDAEVTHDTPNERIAWRSLAGSALPNVGSVRFEKAAHGRGTWMTVDLRYDPPAGPLGAAVAKLFGKDPKRTIEADLRRFKALMETGEIPSNEGPSGRDAR